MKRIVLFILTLQLGISVNAQQITYQPWHGTTSTWVYHHQVADGSGGVYEWYTRSVWSGDTLINNLNYTRMFSAGNGLDPNVQMSGGSFFREDSVTHEQFVLDNNGVEHNITINQFLSLGDSVLVTDDVFYAVNLTGNCNNLYVGDYMVVAELDSFLVDSQGYRSSYSFDVMSPSGQLNGHLWYDSGIGVTGYVTFESGFSMLCYREDNETLDFGPITPPWSYTCNATIDESILSINVYPNPSGGEMQVSGSERIKSVMIYNLLGEPVLSTQPFSEQFSISLNETGIYLCEITGISGKKSNHRLIIY